METPDLSLDGEKFRDELQRMQYLWSSGVDTPAITVTLEECFSTAENPYGVALTLMACTEDFLFSKKSSLAFCVMEAFKTWLTNQEKDLKPLLTTELKLKSYFIVYRQKNLRLIKFVAEVYCWADDNEIFLPYIQDQLNAVKLKEVCESAGIMKLHQYFNIKDFLVQLIFQDKLTVVEDFLKDSPEHQQDVVMFLDDLLGNGKENSLYEKIKSVVEKLNINDARLNKFKPKSLSKLIARYAKVYNISLDLCPNYSFVQKKKALSFMIAKRFIDKSLEGESWKEMIIDHIKDCPELQHKLVDYLIDYSEPEEAYSWFIHFNLDMEKLPKDLLNFCQDGDQQLTKEEEDQSNFTAEENWDDDPQPSYGFKFVINPSPSGKKGKNKKTVYHDDYFDDAFDMETTSGTARFEEDDDIDADEEEVSHGMKTMRFDEEEIVGSMAVNSSSVQDEIPDSNMKSVDFYRLPLDERNVIFVDDPNGFKRLLEDLTKGIDLIGLDCEWKPSFTSQKNCVAVMQLATWRRIYLLDVIALSEGCAQYWVEFNDSILENGKITKLGFDITADKSMVLESLPPLKGFAGSTFLDLASIWHVLVFNHSFKFPTKAVKEESSKGLSHLVYLCFGKTLDKSDQFSNWEKRPLRSSQMVYAALDAYCLLEIFDFLKNSSFEQNIDFDKVVQSSLKSSKPSPKKKNKSKSKKSKKPFDPRTLIGVRNLKAGCGNPPISAGSIKMACDTMVQGLGKKLRSCGVDTWISQESDSPDLVLKTALKDQRIILTRGNHYYKYLGHVGASNCYALQSDPLADQVKEVLGHFNIVLKEEDIFSRCQICNGKDFIEIHNSMMKSIVSQKTGIKESTLESHRAETREGRGTNVGGKRWCSHSVRLLKDITGYTNKGAPIKCNVIPVDALFDIEYFYACEKCGKVYWNGSHWQNELERKKEHNLLE
ncbi:exonuclease mut-7 homolog isoform X2 [Ischnura elegans]|uniref:exonuclease mut-7 homolog isoform X2 n=1 Tax=Ischnura elegans TaxID=197161 RepID=UPI001ED89672|nr:exonuclease mut-7 homolog isoform X2 [Ischnura elegans]